MIRWISDVLRTMHNNINLSPFLDGLKTPFDNEEGIESLLMDGDKTSRGMKKMAQRKNTVFFQPFDNKTRAAIFYQKIGSMVKSDEIKELLNKEFEKLVDWFSKFSDKCDLNFSGLDPIFPLYKMLDPENELLEPNLHIAGIRILRKIIEVGSKELLGIESDDEDEEEIEDEEDLDYSEYINFLASKGCVEFLCDYISR